MMWVLSYTRCMNFVTVALTYSNCRLVWLECLGYINSRDNEVNVSIIAILIDEKSAFSFYSNKLTPPFSHHGIFSEDY